jgi:hypothetical protein
MSVSVKDVEEFSRLFRVKVPLESQFDYYINLLSRSPEYHWLPQAVKQFKTFEEECGQITPGSTKMQWVLRLKEELLNSEPYRHYCRERPPREMSTVQRLGDHKEHFLFRVDIKASNYSLLSIFDNGGRALSDSWESFLIKRNAPEVLHSAKTFRQLIFGYLDSKGFQRHQLVYLDSLFRMTGRAGFRGKDLLVLNGDELILDGGPDPAVAVQRFTELCHWCDLAESADSAKDIPQLYRGRLKLSVTLLQMQNLTDLKNAYCVTHFGVTDGKMHEKFKSLHGVPGSLFYRLFREVILNETPEPKDLLFSSENRLARWLLPGEENTL